MLHAAGLGPAGRCSGYALCGLGEDINHGRVQMYLRPVLLPLQPKCTLRREQRKRKQAAQRAECFLPAHLAPPNPPCATSRQYFTSASSSAPPKEKCPRL